MWPLAFSCAVVQPVTCMRAVKLGATVDAVDQMNVTPLMLAVEGMHMSVARLLLAKNARANVISNSPEGKIMYCMSRRYFLELRSPIERP